MKELGMALVATGSIMGFFGTVIYPDLEYTGGTSNRSCTGECYAEYVRQFGTPAEMERRKQTLAAGDQFSSIRSLWAGCAACHGNEGQGMAVFPALVGKDKDYIVEWANGSTQVYSGIWYKKEQIMERVEKEIDRRTEKI